MRRENRKNNSQSKSLTDKIILYGGIGIGILAVIVFAVFLYSKNLSDDMKSGTINFEGMNNTTDGSQNSIGNDENQIAEDVDAEIGKSVEEQENALNETNTGNTNVSTNVSSENEAVTTNSSNDVNSKNNTNSASSGKNTSSGNSKNNINGDDSRNTSSSGNSNNVNSGNSNNVSAENNASSASTATSNPVTTGTNSSGNSSKLNTTNNQTNVGNNISSPNNSNTSNGTNINGTNNMTNSVNSNKGNITVQTSSEQDKSIQKELKFQKPVDGEIVREYAKENLIFSETLQEWTTHTGIDIKAEKTTVVNAAEEGTVKSIKNDPRYGLTIVIEHVNGFQTVYSNLLTSEFVVEGEKVQKGQAIGTVGNTGVFEIVDEPHLHFEIIKDSLPVDPSLYL